MQNDEDNRLLSHDDCEILPWLRSGIISVPCESAPDLNFAKERCNNFIETFKGVKQEPNYEIKSLIIEEDTCKNLQMSFFFAYGFLGLSALVLLSFIVVQIVQSAMRMKGKNTTVIDEFEDDEVPAPPPPLDLSVKIELKEKEEVTKPEGFSDETMTKLVLQHEAQIERLLSSKYFVAAAQLPVLPQVATAGINPLESEITSNRNLQTPLGRAEEVTR